MHRILAPLVLLSVVAAGLPAAARVNSTTGPAETGYALCVADPAKALAWFEGARAVAGRLGVAGKGIDLLVDKAKEKLGVDPSRADGWAAAGIDASRPVCILGPVADENEPVITFGVRNEAKARDLVVRMVRAASGSDVKPEEITATAVKVGKVKAFRIGLKPPPAQKKARTDKESPDAAENPDGMSRGPVVFFAFADGTGFVSPRKEGLAFLGGPTRDLAPDLALPAGDLGLAGFADFAVIGKANQDKKLEDFAKNWFPRVRLEAALAGSELRLRVHGANGGLMSLIGGAVAKAGVPADVRRRALSRIGEGASGFFQVSVAGAAIIDAIRTSGGTREKAPVPESMQDVVEFVESLSGDLTFFFEDGIVGITLLGSVRDAARVERLLANLARTFEKLSVPLTVAVEDVAGTKVHVLRTGKPDATLRLPIFVAVRDGLLVATLTRARMEDVLAGPAHPYMDKVKDPRVSEALDKGAFVLSHGRSTDYLGTLPTYAAFLKDVLSGRPAAFLDLYEYPALMLDLMAEGMAVVNVAAGECEMVVSTRFDKADPASADAREAAYGRAVKARFTGRLGAWRTALLDLMKTDDNYGIRSRRALLHPQPMSDAVLLGALAGFALSRAAMDSADREYMEEGAPQAMRGEGSTPCQEYLLAACLGNDPEGAACKDARSFFEKEDGGPTPADDQTCAERMQKIRAAAPAEPVPAVPPTGEE